MIKINIPEKYIGTEVEEALLEVIKELNNPDAPKWILLPPGSKVEDFNFTDEDGIGYAKSQVYDQSIGASF